MPAEPKLDGFKLSQVVADSKQYEVLASRISAHVLAFSKWLHSLSGKFLGTVYGERSGPDGRVLAVFFNTSNPTSLWFDYAADAEQKKDWKALHSAGLDTKIAAIKLFPEIVKHIRRQQTTALKELAAEVSEADRIIAELGLGMEGE